MVDGQGKDVQMYVCICNRVTEADVREAARRASGKEDLPKVLGLVDKRCCGRCANDMDRIYAYASDERLVVS